MSKKEIKTELSVLRRVLQRVRESEDMIDIVDYLTERITMLNDQLVKPQEERDLTKEWSENFVRECLSPYPVKVERLDMVTFANKLLKGNLDVLPRKIEDEPDKESNHKEPDNRESNHFDIDD